MPCGHRILFAPTLMVAALTAGSLQAGEADVVDVKVRPENGTTFSFDVTVRHGDEGWDHYADAWEILAPDGRVLATRTLLHPHVDEQPFTRSLGGVDVPAGLSSVLVRAHDSAHGYGGATVEIELPR